MHSERNVQTGVKKNNVLVSVRRVDLWPFFAVRRFPSYVRKTNEYHYVPNDLWAKWIAVMHDFREVQREMRHYYEMNH